MQIMQTECACKASNANMYVNAYKNNVNIFARLRMMYKLRLCVSVYLFEGTSAESVVSIHTYRPIYIYFMFYFIYECMYSYIT